MQAALLFFFSSSSSSPSFLLFFSASFFLFFLYYVMVALQTVKNRSRMGGLHLGWPLEGGWIDRWGQGHTMGIYLHVAGVHVYVHYFTQRFF